MIGLKRGTVTLMPYQKQWEGKFSVERGKLLKHIKDCIIDIQYVGSTSISGMHAKPIIDISAGVRKLKDAEKLIVPLNRLGYKFYRKSKNEIFFAKGPDKKRTYYLHVMRYGGIKWNNDLLFRAYLTKHRKRAKAYAILKSRLAKQYPNDREKYTAGKNKFITTTLQLAGK